MELFLHELSARKKSKERKKTKERAREMSGPGKPIPIQCWYRSSWGGTHPHTSRKYSFLRFWKRSQLMIGNLGAFRRRVSLLDVNWRDRTHSRSHGDTTRAGGRRPARRKQSCPARGTERAGGRPRPLAAGPWRALATGKPMR